MQYEINPTYSLGYILTPSVTGRQPDHVLRFHQESGAGLARAHVACSAHARHWRREGGARPQASPQQVVEQCSARFNVLPLALTLPLQCRTLSLSRNEND